MKFVVAVGNIVDGVTLHGVYETADEAAEEAEAFNKQE